MCSYAESANSANDSLEKISESTNTNLSFSQNRMNFKSRGKFPEEMNQPEGKVLVLYTGGTIGMVRNESGGCYFFHICN